MKFIFIKSKADIDGFKFFQKLGMKIYNIDDLENTDKIIAKMVNKDYKTIFLSNEVASFSEDIIKKYKTNQEILIIIAPNKRI